jgi:alkaline phosphatase D
MTRSRPWALLLLLASPAVAADPNAPLSRIAVGSCADQNKPCPVWGTIADQKPDALILLGDNMYADLDDGKLKAASPEKIAACYKQLAGVPEWQRLRAAVPTILPMWDDHDYGHNDAGVEWQHKDAAQKLFLDFFNVPADSLRRTRKGVYHSETFGPPGKRTQVILLDTRYHRSPLVTGGPATIQPYGLIRKPYLRTTDAGATFLGDKQWQWLEDRLRDPADLRLICSGIQVVSDEHPFEKWGNIPAERDRLFRLIRSTGASGVVILSGDRHLGELSLEPSAAGYPIYDLTASGLNQGFKGWRLPEANRLRVAGMPYGDHFGLVTVDWNAPDPVVSLQLRDTAGEVVLKHNVPLSVLKPRAGAAADATPPPPPPPGAGAIGPLEAVGKVGQTITVQFPVRAGRTFPGKRVLLNSEKDFRSKDNFTVVLNARGMTGKFEGATYEKTFQGKTVRATGTVTVYQGASQIQIDDAAKIEIVDEK